MNYYSGSKQLYRSEGATYPNATVFDEAGRMAELHTWRNQTGKSDITRWYYYLFTGAVTNKLYADGKGTAYTYLDDGRISTRKWARNIITTYGYADTATGSIRTMDYNDDTPSVTNFYNLIGQLMKVEDGTGTTTFGYDLRGRLIAETNAFAVITRSYDTYGRYAEFILNPVNPIYPVQKIVFGYDKQNRLNAITSIVGVETNVFTYSYLSGTQLINGYTATTTSAPSTALIVARSYEPNRNLVSAVTNTFVSSVPSVVSSFSYCNDSIGQRTSRIDCYNGSTVTNTFDYNIRNEVTNAVMNLDEHSIVYDDIGNREQSTVDSDQSSATNLYVANQLNQYTSVNSAGSTMFIKHDLDGNLTCDGVKWKHSYDAENRLVKSEPYSVTNGAYMFEYKYNYKNLRVEKVKKQLSGREAGYPMNPQADPGTWDPIETRRYIWDGFNIAAEIIIDHVTPATNINYYTWGLDLSGTLQGAGGVGGLLADTKILISSTNTYFTVGDANGNITEYLDNTGAVKAYYKYNFAGEITYQSGAMADDFTHRFSTKPFDKKTCLVQFQYRPYDTFSARFISRDPLEELGGNCDSIEINVYLFVDNDSINYWDLFGMQKNKDPKPSISPPYSTAKEYYTELGSRFFERHHRHCANEGNMNKAIYQKHFNQILGREYQMYTDKVRNKLGGDIYSQMAKLASSSDISKLYGVDIKMAVFIKKNTKREYNWKIWINLQNLETCECCRTNKTCGKIRKFKTPKESYKFEYREVLP